MAEEGRQMVKLEKWAGLAGHGKELGFDSCYKKKPLEDLEHRCEMPPTRHF